LLGESVRLGFAAASTDPLKADGVGARLMGLDAEGSGYLWICREKAMVIIHLRG
jgi:hypothetical protein